LPKRIEEGLDQVRTALAYYPPTYDYLLAAFEPVKAGQGRITILIVGFLDPNAPDEIAQPHNPKTVVRKEETEAEDEENEEGADDEEEAIDTGPDPEETAKRFAAIARLHNTVAKGLATARSARDPKVVRARKRLAEQFMELKLAPKMFDALVGHLRSHVDEVRRLEREIMAVCVRQAGMPRKDFISTFPKNETNVRWIDKHVRAKRKHSAPARPPARGSRATPAGTARAREAPDAIDPGPQAGQPRHRDRRGDGPPREEGNGRGEPPARDLDSEEVHEPRPAVPGPDPGGQHRPDEGGGQVRIPPRLQVLDLRDVVDPPGHHARRSPTRRAPSASRCT
jgi:hypothetical protein